jgi:hypothetical protein
MKRLLVAALLALAVLGTATACTDSTGPGSSLAGTYHLRSVNGSSLPVTLCDNSSCYDVLSAEIDLDANGNYQSINRYSDGTETSNGYWQLSGRDLTLVDNFDGFQSYATISGDDLVFTNLGGSSLTAVYSR